MIEKAVNEAMTKAVKRLLTVGLSNDHFAQVILILADLAESRSDSPELERIRANARERAARRRRLKDVSDAEWYGLRNAVFQRDGHECVYCGDTEGPHHVDHVVPISRGGASEIGNLVVACYACNASKQDKLLEEWGGR